MAFFCKLVYLLQSKLLELGIKLRMKILGILHDLRIFFIGKARKIPVLLLWDYHLLLENEKNGMPCVGNIITHLNNM